MHVADFLLGIVHNVVRDTGVALDHVADGLLSRSEVGVRGNGYPQLGGAVSDNLVGGDGAADVAADS